MILSPHFSCFQCDLICLTGLQDVEVFHYKQMEAEVGQDVTIPCIVQNGTGINIVGIEWKKNEYTKLAVYSQRHGTYLHWPNVTVQIEKNSMGSYLHLFGVTKWDSGVYICDLTAFPQGAIRTETELKIKGKTKGKYMQSHTYTPRPHAAVFTGFHIWRCAVTYCPLRMFHVTPDCIRSLLLC